MMGFRGWRERRILARWDEETRKPGGVPFAVAHPLLDDPLERPDSYKPAFAPLRLALAQRYLQHKRHLLAGYQARAAWPTDAARFRAELSERLKAVAGEKAVPFGVSWWMHGVLWFGLALCLLLTVVGLSLGERSHEAFAHVLVHDLVGYADKVHQARSLRQLQLLGGEKQAEIDAELARLLADIAARRAVILNSLPPLEDLPRNMARALDRFEADEPDEGELYKALGLVNHALDQAGIPYYIDASMVTASCTSLLPLPPQLLQLVLQMEREQVESPAVCRSGMLFPHLVEARWDLTSGSRRHPLFFLRRVDALPVVKSVLGLTTDGGYGATVHLDRLEKYVTESVLPMLGVEGQGSMIPMSAAEVPGLRHQAAQNIRHALAGLFDEKTLSLLKRSAAKRGRQRGRTAQARLRQSLFRTDSAQEGRPEDGLSGMPIDALSGLLDGYVDKDGATRPDPREEKAVEELRDALAEAVAFHEFQHLLNQDTFDFPSWTDGVFPDIPTSEGKRHALEEISAYLVTLAKGKDLRLVHLTQLTLFAFNSGLRDSAEDLAARVLLAALWDEARNDLRPIRRLKSNEELLIAFLTLSALPDAILGRLAEQSYARLMELPLPPMSRE